MITRIILDLDDVMNQCTIHALRWHHLPEAVLNYESWPVHVGYDIVAGANHLLGEERFTAKSFWDGIPREFWGSIPLSAEFHYILGMSEALVGKDRICIGTSPTSDPDCAAGKTEWIQRNLPYWLHRQADIGAAKQFKAHPEALLIDDSDKNVDKFREWGGSAILVPRPWNTNHGLNTQSYLSEVFNSLFAVQRLAA